MNRTMPRPRSIARHIAGTLGLLAAALALMTAAAAVPARAGDRDDIAKALAAIAAIAIIAGAAGAADRDDRDDRAPWHHGGGHGGVHGGGHGHPPKPDRWRGEIPAYCAVDLRHSRGTWYAGRCLREAGLRRLPERCAEIVRWHHRDVTVYPERCLVDAGFRPRWRH
jgi:hypothetical protein